VNPFCLVLALSLAADGGLSITAPKLDLGGSGLGLQGTPDGGVPAAADAGTLPKGPDVTHMTFDKDSIRKIVNYHAKEVQDCYERVIADTESKFEGRVLIDMVIDVDGHVKHAEVHKKGTTLKQGRVHDCIVTAIYDWVFPKPGDGRDHPLQYPFDLKYVK
jgi:hypothetical protein